MGKFEIMSIQLAEEQGLIFVGTYILDTFLFLDKSFRWAAALLLPLSDR